MTKYKTQKKLAWFVVAASLIAIATLMNITSPRDIGPFGIVLWFAIIYLLVSGSFCLLWLFIRKTTINWRALISVMAMTSLVVLLVGLRTLNQLHPRDVLVASLLAALGVFYTKRKFADKDAV